MEKAEQADKTGERQNPVTNHAGQETLGISIARRNPVLSVAKKTGAGRVQNRADRSECHVNDAIGGGVDAGGVQRGKAGEHGLVDIVVNGLGAETSAKVKALLQLRRDTRNASCGGPNFQFVTATAIAHETIVLPR